MKNFVIDLNYCNGCYACQIGCKDEHCGNDWPGYAKSQPEVGHFWLKIDEKVRGTVPKVYVTYVPVMCQHCEDAPCIKAFPDVIYRRKDGLVIIDPDKCPPNREIADACPYGAIYWNENLAIAQKCTGCAHLWDDGWDKPRCADNCPTDAIVMGEEADLKDKIAKAEVLHPEYGTKPRVYYINLPKKWIGGTVYDPAAMEVIIGAKVSLSGAGSATVETDEFGDFWFRGLKDDAEYTVTIEANGKKAAFECYTDQEINLGDIAM